MEREHKCFWLQMFAKSQYSFFSLIFLNKLITFRGKNTRKSQYYLWNPKVVSNNEHVLKQLFFSNWRKMHTCQITLYCKKHNNSQSTFKYIRCIYVKCILYIPQDMCICAHIMDFHSWACFWIIPHNNKQEKKTPGVPKGITTDMKTVSVQST